MPGLSRARGIPVRGLGATVVFAREPDCRTGATLGQGGKRAVTAYRRDQDSGPGANQDVVDSRAPAISRVPRSVLPALALQAPGAQSATDALDTTREGVNFVIDAAESDPSLATRRFAGNTLLHFAAGAGCLELVTLLLRLGVDPNLQGRGRDPLYCVANECASETGPEVVRALVRAGADVNACSGVMRATALHLAARRGHVEIARTLLDSGAEVNPRNRKGDTPLQRAINCRKNEVSQLLLERGAVGTNRPAST